MDTLEHIQGSIELFEQLKSDDPRFKDVNPELHIYGQNGHGFGAGVEKTSSELWIPSADLYIQKVMGNGEVITPGNPPERFVLQQVVTLNDQTTNNMDMTAVVYTTADHGEYYMSYVTRGNEWSISGVIIGDHPVEPSYDSSGGYAARYNTHTSLWALCDPTAWQPRE